MSNVVHCIRAALLSVLLASLSVAGDLTAVPKEPDRAATALPGRIQPKREQAGLCMRHPYEPGKVPVVLIHGLWGHTDLWDPMIESLEGERALRERYQFWTFCYASGDCIPFSAHLLREALRGARRAFDPDGRDAAFDRMVVVGHSLGGVLAKMTAQRSGSRLWQTICARPVDEVAGPLEDRQVLRQAFCYEPVPEVRRLVFIATPHRGSPLATGALGALGTRLCWRPSRFLEARASLLARNQPELFTAGFRGELATSAGGLAPGDPLLRTLCDLGIDPSVRFHSIIADVRNPPAAGGTDGFVPYWSAHLEGAASELLVRGLHICLNHPAVIREVGRILREHAGLDPLARTEGKISTEPQPN